MVKNGEDAEAGEGEETCCGLVVYGKEGSEINLLVDLRRGKNQSRGYGNEHFLDSMLLYYDPVTIVTT